MKLVAVSGEKETSSRDRDDEDSRIRTEREKLELRGSEALLRAVMRRVGSGGGGGGGQM